MVGTTRKLAAKSSSMYATFAAGVFPHTCRRLDCARRHESPQAALLMSSRLGNCDLHGLLTGCVADGREVTLFVSLCMALPVRRGYLRQEVGRYLGSSVLPVQVQVMLPACVAGDSSR